MSRPEHRPRVRRALPLTATLLSAALFAGAPPAHGARDAGDDREEARSDQKLEPHPPLDHDESSAIATATEAFAPGASATVAEPLWSTDRRLTFDASDSQTSVNFARALAVDGAGGVHVIWQDAADGGSRILHANADPSGSIWSAPRQISSAGSFSEQPAIAAFGAELYAVWNTRSPGSSEVWISRSANAGQSWTTATELTSDRVGGAHASVAVHGARIDVVWSGSQGAHGEVFSRHSDDRGRTWRAIRRVSDAPFHSWVPTIANHGSDVWIAWSDYRDANEEEYLAHSPDGGRSWSTNRRLTFNPADSWAPTLAFGGRTLHLTWFDRRAAGLRDEQVERALDDVLRLLGADPPPPPPRDPFHYYLADFEGRLQEKRAQVDLLAPGWLQAGGDPRALEAGLTRFTAHRARWESGWEIYYQRSPDGGDTWTTDRRLTFAPRLSARPSVAVDGDDIHIVWIDARDGNGEIYHKYSTDGGDTWSADERLTTAPGLSSHPTIALSPGWVHLAWFDARDGNHEIYTKARRR